MLLTKGLWELDVTPQKLREMKERHPGMVAIASIHAVKAFGFTKESDKEDAPEQTADTMLQAYIEIIDKYGPLLDIVGHPFGYVINKVTNAHMENLVRACDQTGTALELNLAQAGLYKLGKNDGYIPTPAELIDRVPILRYPETLAESDVLIVVGGDLHGNSDIEKLSLSSQYPIGKPFQESSLDYQTLRFMASLMSYFHRYKIHNDRIPNYWEQEEIDLWVQRFYTHRVDFTFPLMHGYNS